MLNQSARYFVPDPSHWPILGSAALLSMASGAALWMNEATWGKFVLIAGVALVAVLLSLAIVSGLWRTPGRFRRGRVAKRHARARQAITQGLLAVGHGDVPTARAQANAASKSPRAASGSSSHSKR